MEDSVQQNDIVEHFVKHSFATVMCNSGVQQWCATVVYNSGVQQWCATVVFNSGVQHWCSTVVFNSGAQMIDALLCPAL